MPINEPNIEPLDLRIVAVGLQAGDGQGDTIRNSFIKINENTRILGENVKYKLTSSRTYYVDEANGVDTNNGLSVSESIKTVAKALDLMSKVDLNGFLGIIQLAEGTYTEAIRVGSATIKTVVIQGDISDPSKVNIVLDYSNGHCITASRTTTLYVSGCSFSTNEATIAGIPNSKTCSYINSSQGAEVHISGCEFGEISKNVRSSHIYGSTNSVIEISGAYKIKGGARFHILVENGVEVRQVSPPSAVIYACDTVNFQSFIGAFKASRVELTTNNYYNGNVTGGLVERDSTSVVKNLANVPAGVVETTIETARLDVIVAKSPSISENSTVVPTTEWVNDKLTTSISNLESLIQQITGEVVSLPIIPVGIVMAYSGSTAPSGYLLCAGQAVSRATYSILYSVIGVQYGSGDGVNTFNVPDLRGRVAIGVNPQTNRAPQYSVYGVGQSGGAETVRLEQAHIPSHTHNLNIKGHSHPIKDSGHGHEIVDKEHTHGLPNNLVAGTSNGIGMSSNNVVVNSNIVSSPSYSGITSTKVAFSGLNIEKGYEDIEVLPAGGGNPIRVTPPHVGMNYIIKY